MKQGLEGSYNSPHHNQEGWQVVNYHGKSNHKPSAPRVAIMHSRHPNSHTVNTQTRRVHPQKHPLPPIRSKPNICPIPQAGSARNRARSYIEALTGKLSTIDPVPVRKGPIIDGGSNICITAGRDKSTLSNLRPAPPINIKGISDPIPHSQLIGNSTV